MWMAVGHHNPVWHRLMPLRLADCFLLKSPPFAPIWVFEARGISTENMGTREHKIQIWRWFTIQIHYLFSDTRPKSMETEADDWSHGNNRLLFYPCLHLFFFFLYPLWAGKRTVTLGLLRAAHQAELLGVNHSFVSLSWHIKLEKRVAARTAGVRDGRTAR